MYDSGVSTIYKIACRTNDYINHCRVLDTAAQYTFRHLTSLLPSGVCEAMFKFSTGKLYRNIKGKGKGKVYPRTGHKGPEME